MTKSRIARCRANARNTTPDLVKDVFAIKAFAEQQGLNISQLQDLSRILIENKRTIDEVVSGLQN